MFNWFRKKSDNPQINPQKNPQDNAVQHKRRFMGGFYSAALGGGKKEQDIVKADIDGFTLANSLTEHTMQQARPLAITSPHAKGYLKTLCLNVVGSKGIPLQARIKNDAGETDTRLNDFVEKAWAEFTRADNFDIAGRLSLRQMLKQAVTCLARDGEFFARVLYKNNRLKIQHLDARLLAHLHNDFSGVNTIVNGIEIDTYGKPLFYYFYESNVGYYNKGNLQKIPANEIIHVFEQDLPSQMRGISWFKTALFDLHNVKQMNNSTLQKARASSEILNFLKYNDDIDPNAVLEEDQINEVYMNGLHFNVIPAGMERDNTEFTFPGNEYTPFVKSNLRNVAVGLGISYNTLASDAESVNYSSIRDFTLKEREFYMDIQEMIIEYFLVPVYEKWIETMLAKGMIPNANMVDFERFCDVDFIGRRWDWIDPLKDAKANDTLMKSFLKSPSQIIRDMGGDPEKTLDEFGKYFEAMKKIGLSDEQIHTLFGFATPQGTPQKPKTPQPEQEEDDSDEDVL